jgi:hypothetical protein
MTAIDIRGVQSDIKINVGCGATPTPGWVIFDNSMSIRMACASRDEMPGYRAARP